jgi:SP family general alpha glucoside:H+ symporter-like MFS transporter
MLGVTKDIEDGGPIERVVSRDAEDIDALKRDIDDYEQVVNDARGASDQERKLTLREGIKLYPAAIAWSVLLSTAIVMEGYGELKAAKAQVSSNAPVSRRVAAASA